MITTDVPNADYLFGMNIKVRQCRIYANAVRIIINGVDVSQYTNPKLSYDTMRKIRIALFFDKKKDKLINSPMELTNGK